jgi:hypothetical protein
MLCGLYLQGCRSDSQVPSKDVAPEKTHVASDDKSASSHVPSPQAPVVFGSQEWSRYFGEVGEEPSLPLNAEEILGSACPFWPEKQVKDTHLLVLIPATVDDKPFSLDLLGDLIQYPKIGGRSAGYRGYTSSSVQEQLGTRSPGCSYWVLMTRDVLEGSRGKDYASQKALVAQYASSTGLPYELPGVLEAATVVLSHYVRSGERLYANAPWTYTRCQELVKWGFGADPAFVGSFDSLGISVGRSSADRSDYYGVASLRKF